MYRRILVAFFVIILIIIALNVWIGREVAKIQPQKEEKKEIPIVVVEEVITPQEPLQAIQSLPDTHEERPLVTIIKPTPKEKPAVDTVLQQEASVPGAGGVAGSSRAGISILPEKTAKAGADAAGAGVTEISTKRPSETERKEMNARGVVMW
jgi:hypothetical protein